MDWNKIAFKNEKRFLSNMYKCKIFFDNNFGFQDFIPDNYTYKSSEHLYQALKSNDNNYQDFIRSLKEPKDTKKYAKKLLSNSFTYRKDFENIKIDLMHMILLLQFIQNPDLKAKLLQTNNDYLEEKNCWNDTFWGTYNSIGENNLGKLLMQVREYLRNR